MRRIILLLSALAFVFTGFAQKYKIEQSFKSEDLQYLKNADVYLGLTDNEEMNTALRAAVKNSWDFTEIKGEETIESLKKKILEGKKLAFICLTIAKSSNLFSDQSGIDAKSKTYVIQVNTEGNKTGLCNQFLCYSEGFKTNMDLSFDVGIKMINSKLKTIDKEGFKNSKMLKDYAIQNSDVFLKKTLYIPREWLDGITEEEFKTIYTKNVKFVNLDEYIEDIKNGKEDMIFVLPLAVPAEGGFVNTHVFTEADGYRYLGLCQKLTIGELQSNIFNSYLGTIEQRHVKLYENTSNGKW